MLLPGRAVRSRTWDGLRLRTSAMAMPSMMRSLIAGSADTLGDTGARAVIWNNGTVQDLTPFDNIVSWAADIINKGQVVGRIGQCGRSNASALRSTSWRCPCFGTLWQNGEAFFLDALVPPEWDIWLGIAINDNGAILARGQKSGGRLELVLLRPIPGSTVTATRTVSPAALMRSSRSGPRALRRGTDRVIHEIE